MRKNKRQNIKYIIQNPAKYLSSKNSKEIKEDMSKIAICIEL